LLVEEAIVLIHPLLAEQLQGPILEVESVEAVEVDVAIEVAVAAAALVATEDMVALEETVFLVLEVLERQDFVVVVVAVVAAAHIVLVEAVVGLDYLELEQVALAVLEE
jgi:hypothetical protein